MTVKMKVWVKVMLRADYVGFILDSVSIHMAGRVKGCQTTGCIYIHMASY